MKTSNVSFSGIQKVDLAERMALTSLPSGDAKPVLGHSISIQLNNEGSNDLADFKQILENFPNREAKDVVNFAFFETENPNVPYIFKLNSNRLPMKGENVPIFKKINTLLNEVCSECFLSETFAKNHFNGVIRYNSKNVVPIEYFAKQALGYIQDSVNGNKAIGIKADDLKSVAGNFTALCITDQSDFKNLPEFNQILEMYPHPAKKDAIFFHCFHSVKQQTNTFDINGHALPICDENLSAFSKLAKIMREINQSNLIVADADKIHNITSKLRTLIQENIREYVRVKY